MRARKVDANLDVIRKAYRKMGVAVHTTNGDWDLTVAFQGVVDLVEVKDGAKPPSARELTDNEVKWAKVLPIRVVIDVQNVIEHVSVLRRKAQRLAA